MSSNPTKEETKSQLLKECYNLLSRYLVENEEPSDEEVIQLLTQIDKLELEGPLVTRCDMCGATITGIENFIDAGDKVVCSQRCLNRAIGEFTHWQNTHSNPHLAREVS